MAVQRYNPWRAARRLLGSGIAKFASDMKDRGPRKAKAGMSFKKEIKNINPNKAVTGQNDMAVQKFKGRRRGGRKMKRMMKFRNKVVSALTSFHNPQWIRFHDVTRTAAIAAGLQGMFVIGTLYGVAGAAGTLGDNRDLFQIYEAIVPRNGYNDSSGSLGTMHAKQDSKLRVQSAYMEATLTNTGNAQCLLDVYECYCRKSVGVLNGNITSMLQDMPTNNWPGIAGTSTLSQQSIGVTPYQAVQFRTAFKIGTKTRYLIPNGQSITVRMSGMGQRTLYGAQMENFSNPCLKGWTRCLVGVVRGVDTTTSTTTVSLSYDTLRMYNVDPQMDMYPNTGTTLPS